MRVCDSGLSAIAVVALVLACWSGAAAAQSGGYQCSSSGGGTYVSRSPCPSGVGPTSTVLRQIGPAPEQPRAIGRYTPSPNLAEPHVQYLDLECARISEGIRTGPTRGVPYSVIGDLRREYNQKCQEDEQAARKLARDDEMRARKDREAVRSAEQNVKGEAARHAARCDEMLGALAAKRRRYDTLSQGEKDDFARFQSNYDERCKAGR
jgi:hypothetical protein